MSQPPPSPSEPPPAAPPAAGRSGWPALAAAVVVFLGFVGYGLFAPTTFRATAQIVLKPTGGKQLGLPASPPPAERLREVAIDSETLEQAALELKLGSGASGQAAAHQRLDLRFEVASLSPDTFDFTLREATATGTQHVANLLARHAAARAVRTLAPAAPDEGAARDAARAKSAAELATFMAAHPELNPPTPSVVPVPPKDAPKDQPDAEISSLRAERDQIQAKLARMPDGAPGSDNPFGEPTTASPEATRMRRRLTEIEQTLTSRKRAEKKAEAAPKVAPSVEREWKRLVQAVAQPTVSAEQAPEPTFTVMLREATLPSAPIDPDRRMVALLGALASLVTAVAITILQAALSRRSAWRAASPPTPRQGSEPPRARSEPPRAAGSDPPRPRSDPPRPGSNPPGAGSEPPRAGSEPPSKPGSTPPQPILAVGNPELAATEASTTDPRHTSSNPPPARHTSSNPPPARHTSSNPPPARHTSSNPPPARHASSNPPPARQASSNPAPARTATGHAMPSPPPQMPTAVGYPPPSPPPPAAAPPVQRPTPGYEELRRMPSGGPVPKGTLVGMAPVDPRALDSTLIASPGEPNELTPDGPFATTPSARMPAAARSTVRPPPPDAPKPSAVETVTVMAEVLPAEPKATPGEPGQPAEPSERDDSWTGPSRAHRRSVNAARRTTQMLGSPIPPVVRGSRPPTHTTSAYATPVPGTAPAGTGYSYVSERPEAAPARIPANTPPYYQTTAGSSHANRPSQRVTPSGTPAAPATPAAKPRVTRHPVRAGWAPDSGVDPRARRTLSDQLFPLAVEGCFVLGVTAVSEARGHKSRIAAEIALALAEPQHPRVLLLEADFQWPAVHQVMKIEMPMSAGFSQQLRARAQAPAAAWTVVECGPTLHVLAEGIMRSPGLILSVQFEEAVRTLRAYYDFIIIDGPAASAEVDCRALSHAIDGAAIVSPAQGAPDLTQACALFPDKRFSTVVGV